MYINDVANSLNLGVPIGDERLSILLYADDVVIRAETEEDLQKMLNKSSEWGRNEGLNSTTKSPMLFTSETHKFHAQSLILN